MTSQETITVDVSPTPNPQALRFIANKQVKSSGNVTYKSKEDCGQNELAKALFSIGGVQQLYFFDNVITVTFSSGTDLFDSEDRIIEIIKEKLPTHNPEIAETVEQQENQIPLSADMQQINEILDRTIRPALQGDGGDIALVKYENNELFVHYQGACGSCPSSTAGTLMAVEGVLRDGFNKDIVVIPL